jgi:hypothetical protein
MKSVRRAILTARLRQHGVGKDRPPFVWWSLLIAMGFIFAITLLSKYDGISSNDFQVIGIKAFDRPDCLNTIIRSAGIYAKNWKIVVADDSSEDLDLHPGIVQAYADTHKVSRLRLPYDSGVGYGRNCIVREALRLGVKFVVISDDDYELTETTNLDELVRILVRTNADVVSPARCDSKSGSQATGCGRNLGSVMFQNDSGIEVIVANPPEAVFLNGTFGCEHTEFVQNFFVARVDALYRAGWDSTLKNNDHVRYKS